MTTQKITHLTSAHPRDDIRIFMKMARSIAQAGHETTLVVADGLGDEQRDDVSIKDAGKSSSRVDRIKNAPRRILALAKTIPTDIYHFHDPELLQIAKGLKTTGAKVIFDSHEDTVQQLLTKPYMSPFLCKVASKTFGVIEKSKLRYFDLVIGATPTIAEKFRKLGAEATNINNFPILDDLKNDKVDWADKSPIACYVGGVSEIRGCLELAQAAELSKGAFGVQVAGPAPEAIANKMKALAPEGLTLLGMQDRGQVRDLMAKSIAGVVTFLPVPNHTSAQPNKMFEYMSAGLPVIASDFPLWRDIIDGNKCGICVDPAQPDAIAEAIGYLIDNPAIAEEMGRNGLHAVTTKYNWKTESQNLLATYKSLAI